MGVRTNHEEGDDTYVESRRPRIVLVSSNPAELDIIARQISPDRFEVHPIADPQQALDFLREHPVDVFVSDENLEQLSGLDLLQAARETDQYTSLVLLTDEDQEMAIAVEAVNRIRITKILMRPWDLEEVGEELEDAAVQYDQDVRKDRHLNLSKKQVTRLSLAVEQTRRDLLVKERQLTQLKQQPTPMSHRMAPEPVAPPPPPPEPQGPAITPELLSKLIDLLSSICGANVRESSGARVAELISFCTAGLKWGAEDQKIARTAATLHHALLPRYPGEKMIEVRGGSILHATTLADHLRAIPGLEKIAETIAHHHSPMRDEFKRTIAAPKPARLLQILSLFDEISHDDALLSTEEAAIDPLLGLNRASEQVLRLAGDRLDKTLCEICIKEFIPRFMQRSERCLSIGSVSEGMILARTVYAENLALVRTGARISASALDKIRYAHESISFPGIWVVDEEAEDRGASILEAVS